jgi:hypothetical protein
MPFILNHRRAWTLLVILFHLFYPATGWGRVAWPAGADTVVQGSREWGKFRKRILRKERRVKDITFRQILAAVRENLDGLENSIQKYAIRHIEKSPGETTYDIAHDVLIFNIQKNNTANFVHETTHGGQYQKGEIVFRDVKVEGMPDTCTGLGDDFDNEVEAYKAQFAYDPGSVTDLPNALDRHPEHLHEINVVWLINLTDTVGTRVYLPNGKDGVTERHINIYSTKKDMIAAYPKADFKDYKDDYVLGNDPNYQNFPAKLRHYEATHRTGHDSLTTPSSPPRSL